MVKKLSVLLWAMLISSPVYAKTMIDPSLHCMVRTTIAEGENQSVAAKTGIMYTIHNRSKAWHKGYCTIVNQKAQFSHRKIKWSNAYHKLYEMARLVKEEKTPDVTHGALFFHDDSLKKNPFGRTVLTARLDNMLFYRTRRVRLVML